VNIIYKKHWNSNGRLGNLKDKLVLFDKTVVEFSVLEENRQLFASQYQLYLPSKEQLIAEIERNIENL